MRADPTLKLLGDIGGTNARFALSRGGDDITHVRTYKTADFPGPEAAIRLYLQDVAAQPGAAALAVACPVSGDLIKLTNSHWEFSAKLLEERLGLDELRIFNDFTAVALALPWLTDSDRRLVGGTAQPPTTPLALVGPGTGLGVSALIPVAAGGWVSLSSEGGHVGFAPTDAREDAVLERLRQRFGRLSAERVISGQGLENLYAVTSEMRDGKAGECRAAEIAALAESGDAAAKEALSLFSAAFGAFAGDLVLMLGAWSGVYIGGGITMKLDELFDTDTFNSKFIEKGRYRDAMQSVPRWLITCDNPALTGLAREMVHPREGT